MQGIELTIDRAIAELGGFGTVVTEQTFSVAVAGPFEGGFPPT
jgi:hypothetical protein